MIIQTTDVPFSSISRIILQCTLSANMSAGGTEHTRGCQSLNNLSGSARGSPGLIIVAASGRSLWATRARQ